MTGKVQRPPLEYRFLPEATIEAEALRLLAEYGKAVAPVAEPPVPVEEIVDCYLELALRYADLVTVFGDPTILGATDAATRTLYVSQTLDPEEHPDKRGRGRFTIAHEVGHWRLHVPLLEARAAQTSLFESAAAPPPILCRATRGERPREEVQADLFAGFLLMPKELVLTAWRERFSGLAPHVVSPDVGRLATTWNLADDGDRTVAVARDLAARFEVSAQAMQIRLTRLGLLKLDARQLDLVPPAR